VPTFVFVGNLQAGFDAPAFLVQLQSRGGDGVKSVRGQQLIVPEIDPGHFLRESQAGNRRRNSPSRANRTSPYSSATSRLPSRRKRSRR
jgi:hypothetical protein